MAVSCLLKRLRNFDVFQRFLYARNSLQSLTTTTTEDDKDVVRGTEEEEEELRDISRMPRRYRDRMSHALRAPDPPDYYTDMHTNRANKRKLYGHFGRGGGVDPGLLWPSAEELKETLDFEAEWEPSLEERWTLLRQTDEAERDEKRQKLKTVESQMSKMPQYIQQYRERLAKAEAQERTLESKRKALLEEARDYFGYDIDPRDPRFEQMKEKKEEEEKKLKKKKKKEEKMAKFMASLK